MGWSSRRTRAQRSGGADLGDGQLGQLVAMFDQSTVKLIKTAQPEFDVGGPVRRVKCAPRRIDRRLGLRHGRVGSVAHQVARGRVVRRKCPFGGEKAPIDQQTAVDRRPGFRGRRRRVLQ